MYENSKRSSLDDFFTPFDTPLAMPRNEATRGYSGKREGIIDELFHLLFLSIKINLSMS